MSHHSSFHVAENCCEIHEYSMTFHSVLKLSGTSIAALFELQIFDNFGAKHCVTEIQLPRGHFRGSFVFVI
jgi:hypothetical protein